MAQYLNKNLFSDLPFFFTKNSFTDDINLKKGQVFGQKNLKNLNEKIDERVTIIIGDDIKDSTNNLKK